MKRSTPQTAQEAYRLGIAQLQNQLIALQREVENLPDASQIHWGHVGDVNRYQDMLAKTLEVMRVTNS